LILVPVGDRSAGFKPRIGLETGSCRYADQLSPRFSSTEEHDAVVFLSTPRQQGSFCDWSLRRDRICAAGESEQAHFDFGDFQFDRAYRIFAL
jgi:hypothetical protein